MDKTYEGLGFISEGYLNIEVFATSEFRTKKNDIKGILKEGR